VGTTVAFNNTGSTGIYTWTVGPPLNVTGTTANFSYTFLNVGTYSITHVVTNAGCTATVKRNVLVSDCAGPTVSATSSSVCQGACAVVTSGVTGGASPYTYSWSNAQTTQDVSGLAAGTYSVQVTDVNGCTSTNTITLTQPAALITTIAASSNYNGQNISCFGLSDGGIDLSVAGGTTAYTYSWSNSSTTQDVSGLTAGNYTVTTTDVNGCSATNTITLTQSAALVLTSTVTPVTCNGYSNGSINVTPTGGNPGFP